MDYMRRRRHPEPQLPKIIAVWAFFMIIAVAINAFLDFNIFQSILLGGASGWISIQASKDMGYL